MELASTRFSTTGGCHFARNVGAAVEEEFSSLSVRSGKGSKRVVGAGGRRMRLLVEGLSCATGSNDSLSILLAAFAVATGILLGMGVCDRKLFGCASCQVLSPSTS